MRSTRSRLGARLCALPLSTLLTLALAGSSAAGCAYFKDTQSMMEEAELALSEGDEARAEELYREVIRSKNKDSEDARRALVSLLLQRAANLMESDPDSAMPVYREVLALQPDSDEGHIAYARGLMQVERFTEAIDVLMNAKGCRGCKSLLSVLYIERGNAAVRDGEYADALEDYNYALEMDRDPLTVLAKVEVYTKGEYGTADDAINYLEQALRYMPRDQVGAQAVWWDKRMEVIYYAALRGENDAIGRALILEDPRSTVDAEQKLVEALNLKMYAASLQIYAQAFDQGIERGLNTYKEAEQKLDGKQLEALRQTLLGLYQQRAAVHLAAGEDGTARSVIKEGLELDEDDRVLNMQAVIAMAARNSGTARKMLSKFEGTADYNRIKALVELAYARKMIEIGQFAAAKAGVERAASAAPDLLETQLGWAEVWAELRLDDMRKAWFEKFREQAGWDYPRARINQYGRSLAHLRLVQSQLDEAAARDFLRGPEFVKRVEALEKRIKDFYPYDAELNDSADAVLVLTRKEGSELELELEGPRGKHKVKIPADGKVEVKLGSTGLAEVQGKLVFGEPHTKVIIDL